MRKSIVVVVLALAGTLAAGGVSAAQNEDERLQAAIDVLRQLDEIPESKVPPSLLSQAHAVAIIPNVIKGAFFVGGRFGKGVLVVRGDDGDWSNPAFMKITGGSLGWQVGAQSTDIFLVFKSPRGVERLTSGSLTLGADASVAAGPVGRETSAATDLQFQAEVYTYSRSRGLFAGVALDGSKLDIDTPANESFYAIDGIGAEQIFSDPSLNAPASAREFVLKLSRAAPQLEPQRVAAENEVPATEGSGLRTYPIGETPMVEKPEENQ